MNRRSFAESLVLAAMAPAVIPGLAATLAAPAPTARPRLRRSAGAATAASPAGPSVLSADHLAATALALAEVLRCRYGTRLASGELAAITEQIRAGLARADLVRRAEQGRGV